MPKVSVIIPCYNEQETITYLLNALYQQTFPKQQMEVIIADANSNDLTREKINEFQKKHPDLDVHIIDNPKRTIPTALNEAIKAAQGEMIVRLDAHCIPRCDYIERCCTALEENLAMNVGGIWDIQPSKPNPMARAIATAAAHPLGVGDAKYRHTQQAQYTDTVPFGSFKRELIQKIGYFDESLLSNEDYEFNARIREIGGKIWLDPQICSTYFARATLKELAKQYFRYGFWKFHMLRRYPHTLRWRQAMPPLFVLSLFVISIASTFSLYAFYLLLTIITIYWMVLSFVSIHLSIKKKDVFLFIGVPLAITTMHISWGLGFLWSFIQTLATKVIKHNYSLITTLKM